MDVPKEPSNPLLDRPANPPIQKRKCISSNIICCKIIVILLSILFIVGLSFWYLHYSDKYEEQLVNSTGASLLETTAATVPPTVSTITEISMDHGKEKMKQSEEQVFKMMIEGLEGLANQVDENLKYFSCLINTPNKLNLVILFYKTDFHAFGTTEDTPYELRSSSFSIHNARKELEEKVRYAIGFRIEISKMNQRELLNYQ